MIYLVLIKFCGIKTIDDINYCNILLPEYAGFIFTDRSNRTLDLKTASILIPKLDKNIKTVGVFADDCIYKVLIYKKILNLDIIQLHGNESMDYIKSIQGPLWKSIRIIDKYKDYYLENQYIDMLVYDTYNPKKLGGTGETFNWKLLDNINKSKMILAGGLNSNNISMAIKKVNPKVVDVSSGIETDGKKDFYKMREFVNIIRSD